MLQFKVMGWVASWQGVELSPLIFIVHWIGFRITMECFCEFYLRVIQERFKWERERLILHVGGTISWRSWTK